MKEDVTLPVVVEGAYDLGQVLVDQLPKTIFRGVVQPGLFVHRREDAFGATDVAEEADRSKAEPIPLRPG